MELTIPLCELNKKITNWFLQDPEGFERRYWCVRLREYARISSTGKIKDALPIILDDYTVYLSLVGKIFDPNEMFGSNVMLGHGGNSFLFRPLDEKRKVVFVTNNLWYNGKLPIVFRKYFKPLLCTSQLKGSVLPHSNYMAEIDDTFEVRTTITKDLKKKQQIVSDILSQ